MGSRWDGLKLQNSRNSTPEMPCMPSSMPSSLTKQNQYHMHVSRSMNSMTLRTRHDMSRK